MIISQAFAKKKINILNLKSCMLKIPAMTLILENLVFMPLKRMSYITDIIRCVNATCESVGHDGSCMRTADCPIH
jgi:hypothetical protein